MGMEDTESSSSPQLPNTGDDMEGNKGPSHSTLWNTVHALRKGVSTLLLAYRDNPYGDWAISGKLHRWVLENVPKRSTILELGSGDGTAVLAKDYTMVSVEHNERFVGKYSGTSYIHAPIRKYTDDTSGVSYRWYDVEVLKQELPEEYDLLLVDGPPGDIGRGGVFCIIWIFLIQKHLWLLMIAFVIRSLKSGNKFRKNMTNPDACSRGVDRILV